MAIDNDWLPALSPEFKKSYYRELYDKVNYEYRHYKVFPESRDLFSAFSLTPLSRVKVVILGQDPYHNDGQAHGLCFSVKPGVRIPPSLQNIFKELNDDLGIPIPKTGYLKPWADQGVLLLNTILTVRRGEAYSHKGMGWERLTDLIIEKLNDRKDPVIFLLWGAPARQKKALITNPWHYVLEAPHPSPLSAYSGYFGCKHFSKTNAILFSLGKAPIDWRIE